jgi:DNA-binding NarL/FixJ family response regulator
MIGPFSVGRRLLLVRSRGWGALGERRVRQNKMIGAPRGAAVMFVPTAVSGRRGERTELLRSLSQREATVIEECAVGTPLKVIAGRLNISEPAVGSYLSRAKKKLAVRSRAALQSIVIGPPSPDVRVALSLWLTSAEVQVAEALLAGARNARIAKERCTSVRTVENQVAQIFQKLHIRSRFELLPWAASFMQQKHL